MKPELKALIELFDCIESIEDKNSNDPENAYLNGRIPLDVLQNAKDAAKKLG